MLVMNQLCDGSDQRYLCMQRMPTAILVHTKNKDMAMTALTTCRELYPSFAESFVTRNAEPDFSFEAFGLHTPTDDDLEVTFTS